MSETSVDIARTLVGMKAAVTQQALQLEMVKQNAQADQAVIALLQEAAVPARAPLPPGQGARLDVTA